MIICSPATPKRQRERERGERRRWDLWDCGDPRKMDRPNVGQITFFSGSTKTREGGIARKGDGNSMVLFLYR